MGMGQFAEWYDSELEGVVQVCAVHVAYFAKAMAKQLLDRSELKSKKAALVFVGSFNGARPTPGGSAYSCSKAFVRFLSDALGVEYSGKVDCLHYEAGMVATKQVGRK